MSLILLGILNSQVTGAAAGAYDLLETQVLSSSAASVTFTGLGSYSDYKHLQLRVVMRDLSTDFSSRSNKLEINSDTGSNYSWHELEGRGSSVVSAAGTSTSAIDFGRSPTDLAAANIWGSSIIDILDFSNTNKYKTVRIFNGFHTNGSDGVQHEVGLYSGNWRSTNAITSLKLYMFNQLKAGSRFSLYGIR